MPWAFLPSLRKEIHYFDWHFERGHSWYQGLYESAQPEHVVRVDVSPNYLYDPKVPMRLGRYARDARFLVLVRDPVARAVSAFRKKQREAGFRGGLLDFVDRDVQALAKSCYATSIQRFRGSVRSLEVLVYEEVVGDWDRLRPICEEWFPEIKEHGGWLSASERTPNAAFAPRAAPLFRSLKSVARWLHEKNASPLVEWGKRLGVRQAFEGKGDLPAISLNDRNELRKLLDPEYRAMQELLGRRLPWEAS